MRKPLSQDARNSLTAFVAVTSLFGACWLFVWLLPDFHFPPWTQPALLGINLLLLVISLVRWGQKRLRRRYQREPNGR